MSEYYCDAMFDCRCPDWDHGNATILCSMANCIHCKKDNENFKLKLEEALLNAGVIANSYTELQKIAEKLIAQGVTIGVNNGL